MSDTSPSDSPAEGLMMTTVSVPGDNQRYNPNDEQDDYGRRR